jgi:hypothetical protein
MQFKINTEGMLKVSKAFKKAGATIEEFQAAFKIGSAKPLVLPKGVNFIPLNKSENKTVVSRPKARIKKQNDINPKTFFAKPDCKKI